MHLARIVRAALLVATTLVTVGLTTSTSAAAGAVACEVDYTITNQWPGGFGTNIVMTNFGDPMSGWTLEWTFPGSQRVTAEQWNGAFTQSGSTVRVRNVSYNGTVATGASVTLGFNGSWSGSNPVPRSFKLNGVPCTGLPAPAPTTTTKAALPPQPTSSTTTQAPVPTTTTTTVAPPPESAPPTTNEQVVETAGPVTFDWPTANLKSAVVLSSDDEDLDDGTGPAFVPLIVGMLLLTGGILVLFEIRRRLLRE